MEKWVQEGCLVNLDLVACLDPKDLPAPLDHLVWLVWMVKSAPRVTWVLRVSQAHQDSREIQAPRVFQVRRVQLVHPEKKGLLENRVFLACLVQMVLRAILVKKVPLEKKAVWVHLAHKVQSDIQDLGG